MKPESRRKTLRMISNGLYVMTSRSGDRYGAATVTWVSQVSFRPPLIMAAVRPESNVYACLRESGVAAVHIIGRGQEEMARRFFAPTRANGDGINGEPFQEGATIAPILSNAPAYLEGRVLRILDGLGDHALVVLEVVSAECRAQVPPGRFGP
jgi:flavin reductase (DIM6/NTAB) family NADH-FMN oxidoreductase RutF